MRLQKEIKHTNISSTNQGDVWTTNVNMFFFLISSNFKEVALSNFRD